MKNNEEQQEPAIKSIKQTPKEETDEKEEESSILKPTTSYEEIMDNNKKNNDKQIAMRIEKYNYKYNMENPQVPSTNENLVQINDEPVNVNRIKIKSPKKNNFLIIILIIVVLFLAGSFIFKQSFKEPTPSPQKKEEKPLEPTIIIEETTCNKITDNSAFGYNYIEERKFYSIENKLQKYEFTNKFDYINTIPATLDDTCNSINKFYNEYEGYTYSCIKKGKTYAYVTNVDLTILEEKELSFNLETGIVKKTILENKDQDVNNYTKKLEEEGFTCETK